MRSEQLGYYLAKPEEWWDILWRSGFGAPLDQLGPDAFVQFKAEHLAAVAELVTAQGIWLKVVTIFAVGQTCQVFGNLTGLVPCPPFSAHCDTRKVALQ